MRLANPHCESYLKKKKNMINRGRSPLFRSLGLAGRLSIVRWPRGGPWALSSPPFPPFVFLPLSHPSHGGSQSLEGLSGPLMATTNVLAGLPLPPSPPLSFASHFSFVSMLVWAWYMGVLPTSHYGIRF